VEFRDSEYVAGKSKVLHYTTLHLQPWRPFPRQFVYQTNPVGHVWLELERSADAGAIVRSPPPSRAIAITTC